MDTEQADVIRVFLAWLLDQTHGHGGQQVGLWKGEDHLNWTPPRESLIADYLGTDLMTGGPQEGDVVT